MRALRERLWPRHQDEPGEREAMETEPATTSIEPEKDLRERIIDELKTVFDPEIPVNIYELGLIYEVDVGDDGATKIIMTLTTPMCPAAEELPPKSRAYGVSMLVLLAGLGSGMVVWVLPAADVANWGWRIVYGLAILLLPFAVWAAVQLPTTRRFAASVHTSTKNSLRQLSSSPVLRRRLALLGIGAMCATVFATPASQFDNQFLRDELGFSASRISLFTVVTSTPIGIGVLAGGMLADRVGRRPIGAIGTVIGTSMTLLSFFSTGLTIWIVRGIGVVLGAGLAIPALAVYGPELFPTRLRSTANGVIIAFGVVGSVVGLQLVGRLAERWDAFGPALAVAMIGPVILTVLIVTRYPETANKTLEEINDEPELESA